MSLRRFALYFVIVSVCTIMLFPCSAPPPIDYSNIGIDAIAAPPPLAGPKLALHPWQPKRTTQRRKTPPQVALVASN